MRKILFVVSIAILSLTGCTSPRQMTLFSSNTSNLSVGKAPKFVIAPNDMLSVKFTAVDSAVVSMFNSAGTEYLVNEEGKVMVPIIGSVKLAGMDTEEAVTYLTNLLNKHVIGPMVKMQFINAYVTVLGEVNEPSCVEVPGPVSLPQVIGMAGGFTSNAQLKDVVVLRHENEKITKYHVNLLNDDLFASPVYYLQKGDVVTVSPLHAK